MTATRLRLGESERRLLIGGAAALGVDLDSAALADFARFADLLDLWCPRVNLLSCGSARELVERHFLDSLALGPLLPDRGSIVDLGTGAGFPGIPLAITRRDQRFVLVEARRKRVTFIREVKRTLGLVHLEILEQRAEDPPEPHAHAARSVVSRAVWSDAGSLGVAARWLAPNGELFLMRSAPLAERAELSPFTGPRTINYRIGMDRPRVVEVMSYEPSFGKCST